MKNVGETEKKDKHIRLWKFGHWKKGCFFLQRKACLLKNNTKMFLLRRKKNKKKKRTRYRAKKPYFLLFFFGRKKPLLWNYFQNPGPFCTNDSGNLFSCLTKQQAREQKAIRINKRLVNSSFCMLGKGCPLGR